MVQTAANSFTAAAVGPILTVGNASALVEWSVSGTYSGHVLTVERSKAGRSGRWVVISGPHTTDDATLAGSEQAQPQWLYRISVADVSGADQVTGTIVTSINDEDRVIEEFKNADGLVVLRLRDSGIEIPGALDVTGDLDVTGALAVTGAQVNTAAVETLANVGVSAATSVKEYGDGYNHTTVLTCTGLALPQPTGGSALGVGDLVYTFPAGAVILDSAYMNVDVTIGAATKTDEADIGLGSVIATGAVSVLGGSPTFEDIITGQLLADVDGTDPVPVAAIPTVGAPLFIASGDAHTVHFNVASDWADAEVAAQDLEYTGVIVLNWKFVE